MANTITHLSGSNGPQLGQPEELQSTNPFSSLVQSFRDVFFPEKLPPLVLESKPIAVADPMAVKRDPKTVATAVGVHALLFLLVFWVSSRVIRKVIAKQPELKVVTFDTPPPPPVMKIAAPKPMGGGGGAHDIAPVTQGRLPKFSPTPIVPPSNPPKIEPKLTVDPAINVQTNLHMTNNNMPNLGMPNAPNVGVGSLGNGSGGGLGNGRGNGLGNGTGGNYGGGVNQVGGDVSAPKILYSVDAEFSEEARKAKYQGEVIVHLIIDASGHPSHLSVPRPVGMGLDENAKLAVAQWRFKPALKNGQPVPVEMNIAVNFQIF